MDTAAILPVKRFARAKQRLGSSVQQRLRRELAGAMVADVLAALAETRAIGLTIVVTAEPDILLAPSGRAIVVDDGAEAGQSAAASLGIARAVQEGYERVLCVPGDCPALEPAELERLLAASGAPQVVAIPDRHGSGTNGLLLSPPGAIAPSFGPESFARHRELARAAGVGFEVARPASLLLDIDTGADLEALRERLATTDARATRTRAALAGRVAADHVRP